MATTTPELIDAAEAAEILHMSRRHVSRLAAAGHLTPAAKGRGVRGLRLFDRADVIALKAKLAAKAAD
ncbi:helix-turn-helix domain-containing protein [Jiangella gansuensis]|uniref:helix-turn-helix domain-containing protein n=1 Tax=Jiangella gansuensis TaxID=281473 RepID=UPI00047D249B|nr:helix-turn-helix domain-containing protein [Jiangella gansuensis]